MKSNIRIALAGNPNSGKTTLFNALTGANQYVGNWPGVTVEKKEGKLRRYEGVTLTDLPGVYSLSPYTPEEVVARNYLVEERPDAILNIVDGTNIERNLYLTTQLMELGIPVVVAVNMIDLVRKRGDKLQIHELSKALGCRVVELSALKEEGVMEAAEAAIVAANEPRPMSKYIYSGEVEHALAHIEEATILHEMPLEQQRWYSVKLFERDSKVLEALKLDEKTLSHIEQDIRAVEESKQDDSESIITDERYRYVAKVLKTCYKRRSTGKMSISNRIDRVVTNRFLALPIFAGVMFLVYYLSIGSIGDWTVAFMNDTLFGEWIIPFVTDFLTNIGCWPWLVSLVADGIIGGVGAVLGFVPQMMILFLLLSLLEDIGYMSRVAFIMDRIFRKFGLSGKSFIPMLIASGCGVPGIMAARTIEQEKERRMTVMTTGFIPCGAKMPIVGFVASALFGGSAWVATAAYFIGIAAVVLSGILLKKTKPFCGEPSPFVMELPPYHLPRGRNILRTTWDRAWGFIKRAGTVILLASIVIWLLNSLSFEGGFHYITGDERSILNVIGSFIAVLFRPLGFGTWQAAVATLLGLVAKEEVVGVFGTLSQMGVAETAFLDLVGGSALGGFTFMIFNLLCAPCFAAMGAIKREMNDWRWTAFAIGYMCVFAYAVSLIVYQFGRLFAGQGDLVGTIVAAVLLLVLVVLVVRPDPAKKKSK